MNSILNISTFEPAMHQLQTILFGEDGMSGYFGKDFSLDERELESIAAVSYTHLDVYKRQAHTPASSRRV